MWIGKYGNLIEILETRGETISYSERYSTKVTVEGNIRAHAKLVSRRQWGLSSRWIDQKHQATLMDFYSGAWGNGPFLFVSGEAPTENLLTPECSSSATSISLRAGHSFSGPVETPDGWAPQSIGIGNTQVTPVLYFGGRAPVIPTRNVTGAAYIRGSGSFVSLIFYDSSGTEISRLQGNQYGNENSVTRVSVTGTPPVNAASVEVIAERASLGTRPSITWSDELLGFSGGRGCEKAIITSPKLEPKRTSRLKISNRFSDADWVIMEVG